MLSSRQSLGTRIDVPKQYQNNDFSTKASQMAVYLGIWKKKEKYCTPLVVALWNMMPCFTVIIIINSETTTCVVISEELLFRCCYH